MARVQIRGNRSLIRIKRRHNTYDVMSHTSHNAATSWITYYSTFLAAMLKIQIADTDIDINLHNYHTINTRNLWLGLVHGWHYMVSDLALVFVLGFGFIF